MVAADERFAFLNAYQGCYPHTFLLTERLVARWWGAFLPRSRPFDNVRLGFDVPYEDELAMTSATLPYVLRLAEQGMEAVFADPGFAAGVNVHAGAIRKQAVAEALGRAFEALA